MPRESVFYLSRTFPHTYSFVVYRFNVIICVDFHVSILVLRWYKENRVSLFCHVNVTCAIYIYQWCNAPHWGKSMLQLQRAADGVVASKILLFAKERALLIYIHPLGAPRASKFIISFGVYNVLLFYTSITLSKRLQRHCTSCAF